MFKVKWKDTGEITTILSVRYDDTFNRTYFLYYDVMSMSWRWDNANKFLPPNA